MCDDVGAVITRALDLLCASGTSYFGVPRTPYVPGGQGVGTVESSAAFEPGSRVWFFTRSYTPGKASGARAPGRSRAPLPPTAPGHPSSAIRPGRWSGPLIDSEGRLCRITLGCLTFQTIHGLKSPIRHVCACAATITAGQRIAQPSNQRRHVSSVVRSRRSAPRRTVAWRRLHAGLK